MGAKPYIKALLDEHIPVVIFDLYVSDLETNYIITDNGSTSYNATQHLLKNGYQNIGLVTIKAKQTQMIDLLAGYNRAISRAGLKTFVLELLMLREICSTRKI